jgi:hypothetical protein
MMKHGELIVNQAMNCWCFEHVSSYFFVFSTFFNHQMKGTTIGHDFSPSFHPQCPKKSSTVSPRHRATGKGNVGSLLQR